MILNNNVILNGVEYSNFVFIKEITDVSANVNISNTEVYFSVPITDQGIEQSINAFFSQPIEV